jgi:preprotein translocase SecE subunit
MNRLIQYIKDTRSELHHVAWPTQTQTIVYTILTMVLSVGVAFYLGLFDFLFTTALTRAIHIVPVPTPAVVVATSTIATSTTHTVVPLQISTSTR